MLEENNDSFSFNSHSFVEEKVLMKVLIHENHYVKQSVDLIVDCIGSLFQSKCWDSNTGV